MAAQGAAETPSWSVHPWFLVLEEELLGRSGVVYDVGLAIQLSICEFARVIFVFVIAPKLFINSGNQG